MKPIVNSILKGAAALLVLFALSSCGDDEPAPSGPVARSDQVTVSAEALSFEEVCLGESSTLSFQIRASASNAGDVSGDVSISQSTTFTLAAGGGAYTLGPGDSLMVEVTFAPSDGGWDYAEVEIGAGGTTVFCDGYGAENPWVFIDPTSAGSAAITSNYDHGTVPDRSDVGVSYSDPDWHSCAGPTWVFDGNPVYETWWEFELNVPAGTTDVLIAIGFDASGECAQLLMEIDGVENTRTNFGTPCTTRYYRFGISPGRRTIRIGTDQQGVVCHSDISVQHVRFTFEGSCLPPAG